LLSNHRIIRGGGGSAAAAATAVMALLSFKLNQMILPSCPTAGPVAG
jgi:hypothetical protein